MTLRRWQKASLTIVLFVSLAGFTGLAVKTRSEAQRLVTNPRATRTLPRATPAERGMAFESVSVRTPDGLKLAGWYIPSFRREAVMLVHGYKDHRGNLLGVADILRRKGFPVLMVTVRAHDESDGEIIGFGVREMQDLGAWLAWLQARADVDPGRIGLFGVSMGGTLAIQFAADHPAMAAVVADCAFSSVEDTVETSVRFFTGLPSFPFAPMIMFWMEREIGGRASEIDAKRWIPRISPRPVFLLQGGADEVISAESGARLYEAAGSPKELWFDPDLGHAQFLAKRPQQFEERVGGFFEKHLSPRTIVGGR